MSRSASDKPLIPEPLTAAALGLPPDEEVLAEVVGTFLGPRHARRAPAASQPRSRRPSRAGALNDQRRTVRRFDALAVGGPLDGLRLLVEAMSDGTAKVVGGQIYGDDLHRYRLAGDRLVLA